MLMVIGSATASPLLAPSTSLFCSGCDGSWLLQNDCVGAFRVVSACPLAVKTVSLVSSAPPSWPVVGMIVNWTGVPSGAGLPSWEFTVALIEIIFVESVRVVVEVAEIVSPDAWLTAVPMFVSVASNPDHRLPL